MKRTYVLFIFFFFILCKEEMIGQNYIPVTKVCFSYDMNGNRNHFVICVLKMKQNDSANSRTEGQKEETEEINSSTPDNSITVFPNPTQGTLTIQLNGFKRGVSYEYSFYTLYGQELLNKKSFSEITQIDLTGYRPGIFILTVKVGNEITKWKIIIEQ